MSPNQQEIAGTITAGRGSLDGPFGATLHCPPLADLFQKIGAYIRFESKLPGHQRELAILIVAQRWNCYYEQLAHEQIARREGLEDAIIEALRAGQHPTALGTTEDLIYRFVHTLSAAGSVDDDLFEQARGHLGEATLSELVGLTGYYTAMAFYMNVDDFRPAAAAKTTLNIPNNVCSDTSE